MKLTSEQIDVVKSLVERGAGISEIQSELNALLDACSLTYMETHFLLDDLGLQIKEKQESRAQQPNEQPAVAGENNALPEGQSDFNETPGGRVRVTVDPIQRPGLLASGHATFSDAETAEWRLDVNGRLALIPARQGYRPSPEDTAEFQKALQDLLG